MAKLEFLYPIMESLVQRISNTIVEAQKQSYKALNFIMVEAYWNIGKMIVEEEQLGSDRAEYGKVLVPQLAQRLTNEHGKVFSAQSLWNYRLFYQNNSILSTVWRELSWSHYRVLMRVQNEDTRVYYRKEAKSKIGGVRSLTRQVNTFYYDRLIASPDRKKVEEEAISSTRGSFRS